MLTFDTLKRAFLGFSALAFVDTENQHKSSAGFLKLAPIGEPAAGRGGSSSARWRTQAACGPRADFDFWTRTTFGERHLARAGGVRAATRVAPAGRPSRPRLAAWRSQHSAASKRARPPRPPSAGAGAHALPPNRSDHRRQKRRKSKGGSRAWRAFAGRCPLAPGAGARVTRAPAGSCALLAPLRPAGLLRSAGLRLLVCWPPVLASVRRAASCA